MGYVRLVFVGSPLVDEVFEHCDEAILQKYNLKPDGCVKATKLHDDLLNSLSTNFTILRRSAGGSAVNSARTAKWILKEKGEVTFIGCAGRDNLEHFLRHTLNEEDIITRFIRIPGQKTGMCACFLTDQGGRSMITKQGAAASLSPEHLEDQEIHCSLLKANHIFVVGYLLSHSSEAVHATVNMCRDDQMLSLSLSAEYICREYTEELLKIVSRVDFMFGNESEVVAFAEAVTEGSLLSVSESLSIISQLPRSSNRPLTVLVTRGSDPVIVHGGSEDLKSYDIPENVSVVDGVGCGDAFAGTFSAVFEITRSLKTAVESGIKVATQIAQINGFDLPSQFIEL